MQWSKCLYCYNRKELWSRISSQAISVYFGRTSGSHSRWTPVKNTVLDWKLHSQSEKLLLALAANQLKWQHWQYLLCCKCLTLIEGSILSWAYRSLLLCSTILKSQTQFKRWLKLRISPEFNRWSACSIVNCDMIVCVAVFQTCEVACSYACFFTSTK